MRIAFYAPMKSPDDQVPSGDRAVARGLVRALEMAGHDVIQPSRFRSYERGDPARQARIGALGPALARRVLRRLAPAKPDLWFTYHLYHKAPDLLGPAVAKALAMPYVVCEASVAEKQRNGRWAHGFASALQAIGAADLAIGLNPADAPCLIPALKASARYRTLPPFIDASGFRAARARKEEARQGITERFGWPGDGTPILLSVAMMRQDQKLASYRVLAEALRQVARPFRLLVIGDGPARAEVETAFGNFRASQTIGFAGSIEGQDMPQFYAAADLFVWPAIKEAWSMALIEAGAAGLPVVAGKSGGVSSVVMDGRTGLLTQEGDAAAFGQAVESLLGDPRWRAIMGEAAAAHVAARHDIAAASQNLSAILAELMDSPRRQDAMETAR